MNIRQTPMVLLLDLFTGPNNNAAIISLQITTTENVKSIKYKNISACVSTYKADLIPLEILIIDIFITPDSKDLA